MTFRNLKIGGRIRACLLASSILIVGATAPAKADPSISRGHYLAIAADCAACHTNGRDGAFLAGGYAISSPMGEIYSTNITPSKQYGIGNYTLEQFSRALRHGVRADGSQLYPAMPYGSYSGLTDADVASLYEYIMTEVKPVEAPAPVTHLPFPFSMRISLLAWKLINSIEGKPYVFDHAHDDAWNRGKYLVNELEHCGECHTPRNFLLAPKSDAYLAGADIGSWRAPNITNDAISGIGGWSDDELLSYLQTGKSEHARAAGPMAEAVEHSLSHLPTDDIKAIITYLRAVPAIASPGQTIANFAAEAHAPTYNIAPTNARRGDSTLGDLTNGAALYETVCASCHQSNGKGSPDGYYPSLVTNTTTGQANPNDLIASILFGVDRTVSGHEVLMPDFGRHSLVQPLTDVQIASIANYVLEHFGNSATKVTADAVESVRKGGSQVAIAKLASPGVMAGLAAAFLVIAGLALAVLRRVIRRH